MWNIIDTGNNLPGTDTIGQRLVWKLGSYIANKKTNVFLGKGARIHPGVRIFPRNGKIHIGKMSYIADQSVIQGNVTIGENCSVNIGAIILGYGSAEQPDGMITIGDNVRIAPRVMMVAANHNFDNLEISIRNQGLKHSPIVIGDDVWIAGNSVVTAGVKIGNGSVIGAGSVVTKDIPENAVAAGVPARVLRYRGEINK